MASFRRISLKEREYSLPKIISYGLKVKILFHLPPCFFAKNKSIIGNAQEKLSVDELVQVKSNTLWNYHLKLFRFSMYAFLKAIFYCKSSFKIIYIKNKKYLKNKHISKFIQMQDIPSTMIHSTEMALPKFSHENRKL